MFVPLGLAACGGDDQDDKGATRPYTDEPRGPAARTAPRGGKPPGRGDRDGRASGPKAFEPSIRILKPTNGQTVHGGAVTVSVSVKGFKVVNQQVRPPFPRPVAGKGHLHFYLDTETLPRTHSPPSTGTYRSVSMTTYTWTGVPPGRHTFAVQLVGKDHVPLSAPVKDQITATTVG
jgi:hypothetical protein